MPQSQTTHKLKGKSQTSRIKWTDDMRIALALMFEEYNFNTKRVHPVLIALFKDELAEQGIDANALKKHTLYAQVRKRDRAARSWRSATLILESAAHQRDRDEMLGRIRATAAALDHDELSLQGPKKSMKAIVVLPGPVTPQKRKSNTVHFEHELPTSSAPQPTRKRAKTSVTAAVTLAGGVDSDPQTPLTPTRALPKQRREKATVLYETPAGRRIWLTPTEYQETQQPLTPLVAAAVHSPLSDILYRYSEQAAHPFVSKRAKNS
ncbi:hypothetical protein LTR86_006912 [Recurvomyces mirabilis]|nr:hypothetical protein LTR86_006912 [Recurvomyces mirabilis]